MLFKSFRNFISNRFSLHEDKAEEFEIIDSIRKNVDFKGVNLWTLIFAIFIASIGLNVNSTAVIIGAMLVSPIMGPVTGIGLGIGINDLDLVKKGARNLFIATLISIITSSIYFAISPLHEAQSELLARTSPSIWDVFIAFFGGLAGMVAASRKEKTNVVPGVAIATALMPPLCTAGFGIATGNWYYFLGALYLYFINSLFIAIATYLMARYLRIHKRHFEDPSIEHRVKRYIIIMVIITIAPSIFMAYRIVDKSIFETNAGKFVEEQLNFKNTQVVSKSYIYDSKKKTIDLLLIGDVLDKRTLDSIKKRLTDYQLQGVKLNVRQGLNAKQEIDFSQIKASILEDVFSKTKLRDTTTRNRVVKVDDSKVLKELTALYPTVQSFGLSQTIIHYNDTTRADTVPIVLASFNKQPKTAETVRIEKWLRVRYNSPSLKLVVR